MTKQSHWYIHPALISVGLIYGANYNIAKIALNGYLPPFAFITIRVLSATVLLWLLHGLVVKEKIESRRDYLMLAKSALFGVAINQLLFFKGLSLTTAINASIIMTSAPVLVMLMAYFILKDKIGFQKVIGLLLGLSGAVMLIYKGNLDFSNDTFVGDFSILCNAASYGYYLIIVKKLMVKYHPLTVTKWIFTFGSIFVFPFGLSEMGQVAPTTFPVEVWLSIAYVITLNTVLVYWLNALTLGYVSPSIVGMYIYLQPFFATTIAILFFGEELSVKQVAAAALIFVGVFLVNKTSKIVSPSLKSS